MEQTGTSCLRRKVSEGACASMARVRVEHAEARDDNGPRTEWTNTALDAAIDGDGGGVDGSNLDNGVEDECWLTWVMIMLRGHRPARDRALDATVRAQAEVALATDGGG